jgi:nucleoside 2-deoxyribosyltransferase
VNVYLAGPDVFLPDALDIGRRKREICARYGVIGHYPLDNTIDRKAADASLRIFKGNQAMMDAADAIIANLTPFRGPSADAGTVYELGYMAGLGNVPRLLQRSRALRQPRGAVRRRHNIVRWTACRFNRIDSGRFRPSG